MHAQERARLRAAAQAKKSGATVAALLLAVVVVAMVSLVACSAQSTQPNREVRADATARAQACTEHNGDAARLADIYAPMFDGNTSTAQQLICTAFVDAGGHAFGFGEVQRVLDITATIEKNGGSTACMIALSSPGPQGTPGTPTLTGTPTPTSPSSSQASWTVPSASSATTMAILKQVQQALDTGVTLEQLVHSCHVPGRPASAPSATRTPKP
jgi:type II secretory pathway pseudopilin PulG